ncbi:Mannan endo-1,4-beta-mannosidase [compost metagenome]
MTTYNQTIEPCNPEASAEVRAVLNYLANLEGKGILTGQHTQTAVQKELRYIEEVTGRLPALCGFELLAYSPGINYEDADEECLTEIEENKNTLEQAWDWALNRKGMLTFTWHWFSPFGGRDKSFYSKNTTFDARQAVIAGTPEHAALLSDMDYIADLLRTFADRNIPIIWRPFHEAEGIWFWWGMHGPETARQLYRLMYDRYTNHHKLNNLIWVWNSPLAEGYVGDDVVDLISRDLYPPEHQHTDRKEEYDELIRITPSRKPAALAEIGSIPSIEQLAETRVPWLWYMTWSNAYGASEEWTTNEVLYRTYHHDYAVTLDKLPSLY